MEMNALAAKGDNKIKSRTEKNGLTAADKIITVHIGYNSVKIGREIWRQYEREYMNAPSPAKTRREDNNFDDDDNKESWAKKAKEDINFDEKDEKDADERERGITISDDRERGITIGIALWKFESAKPNPLLDLKSNPRAVYVNDETNISDIITQIKALAGPTLPCFNIIADLDSPKYYNVLSAIKRNYASAIILNICIIPAKTRVIDPTVDNLILYNIAAISNFTNSTILIDYDTVTKGMIIGDSTRIYRDDVVNKIADILSYYIHVMFVNESTRQEPHKIAKDISTTKGIATLAYVDDAESPAEMAQKLTNNYLVEFEKSTIVYRYVICENKKTLKNIDNKVDNEQIFDTTSLSTKHNKEFRRNYRRDGITGRGGSGGSGGSGGRGRVKRADAPVAALVDAPVDARTGTPLPPPRGLTIVIDTGIKKFFENLREQLKISTNKLLNDILKAVVVFGDKNMFSKLNSNIIDFDNLNVPDLAKDNSELQGLVSNVKSYIVDAIKAIMNKPTAIRSEIDIIAANWFNTIYNYIYNRPTSLHNIAKQMGLSDTNAEMIIGGILYYDAPPTDGVKGPSPLPPFEIKVMNALGGVITPKTQSDSIVKDYANLIIFLILKNVDINTKDPLRIKAIIHLLLATLNKAPSNSKMFMLKLVLQLEAINRVDLEILRLGEIDNKRTGGAARGGARKQQQQPQDSNLVLSKQYIFTFSSTESL